MAKTKPAGLKSKRTTITVPPDLKARMDAVQEEVNWSSVAAEAFARKLDRLDGVESTTVEVPPAVLSAMVDLGRAGDNLAEAMKRSGLA